MHSAVEVSNTVFVSKFHAQWRNEQPIYCESLLDYIKRTTNAVSIIQNRYSVHLEFSNESYAMLFALKYL